MSGPGGRARGLISRRLGPDLVEYLDDACGAETLIFAPHDRWLLALGRGFRFALDRAGDPRLPRQHGDYAVLLVRPARAEQGAMGVAAGANTVRRRPEGDGA